jgi:hypothetical protein
MAQSAPQSGDNFVGPTEARRKRKRRNLEIEVLDQVSWRRQLIGLNLLAVSALKRCPPHAFTICGCSRIS